MKKLTVDRIEDSIAVCMDDNEIITELCISDLPFEVREGKIIIVNDDGSFEQNIESEEERREELFGLQESLFDE